MNKSDVLSSPHKHDGSSVSQVMASVCLALVPGLLCYIWFFGFGVLIQCLLSVCFALGVEAILLTARKRKLSLYLKDGSVIVTGLLFALMITPFAPWWISLIGVSFGLAFGKHVYGGLGHNAFNPAVAGYIFVLLCFPAVMNHWPVVDANINETVYSGDIVRIIFRPATIAATSAVDSLSGATPLANMQSRLANRDMVSEIRTGPAYGHIGGKGWEWINLAFLCGGIGLLVYGVIGWRIPLSVLGSFFLTSMFLNFYDPEMYAGPAFHLFSGGTILGAFFIATDPVTASTTPRGRICYGCLIGITACTIRTWGAYPDGIAFAVLIANAFVPLIDKYTRPAVLGENRNPRG